MSEEFKKEDRYLVIKRSDIEKFLTCKEMQKLYQIAEVVNDARTVLTGRPLNCVVVESDWSIYNDVWGMIEAISKDEPTELEQLRKELEEVKRERDFLSDTVDQLSDHVNKAELEASAISCKLAEAKDIIESAVNGIEWYQSEYPESVTGYDDEFLYRAKSFISKGN